MTTKKNPKTPTRPPEPKREPTYEDKAVNLARHMIEQLCQHVPELRSAVVVFDWKDRLSEISVPAVFWTGEGPPQATDPQYVAGLLSQLSRVFQMETHLALTCINDINNLIMSGREQLIRESELSDAEKASLLASIGRAGD